MKRGISSPSLELALGSLAAILGGGALVENSLNWYFLQQSLAEAGTGTVLALVSWFYLAEGLAIASLVVGAYLITRILLSPAASGGSLSIRSVLAGALSSGRNLRLGVAAATVYALVYVFVSGTLVYQPGAALGPGGWSGAGGMAAAACCGAPGTVPSLVVYLSVQNRLALQLVPVNVLFSVVVPLLVGFDVAVAAHSLRSGLSPRGRWFGSVGLLTGLFTGCPTCAGLFLAGAVGGLGATTLAVALAPYQLLFILVSIPLLLASPLLMADSLRRTSSGYCTVPPRS